MNLKVLKIKFFNIKKYFWNRVLFEIGYFSSTRNFWLILYFIMLKTVILIYCISGQLCKMSVSFPDNLSAYQSAAWQKDRHRCQSFRTSWKFESPFFRGWTNFFYINTIGMTKGGYPFKLRWPKGGYPFKLSWPNGVYPIR